MTPQKKRRKGGPLQVNYNIMLKKKNSVWLLLRRETVQRETKQIRDVFNKNEEQRKKLVLVTPYRFTQ